jgi:hypothetical protein
METKPKTNEEISENPILSCSMEALLSMHNDLVAVRNAKEQAAMKELQLVGGINATKYCLAKAGVAEADMSYERLQAFGEFKAALEQEDKKPDAKEEAKANIGKGS